jgi:DeoR family transcriptional regulator, fructose operon transcriptional repressor
MNSIQDSDHTRSVRTRQQRRDSILDLVYTTGFTSVAEVAQKTRVSEMTIRRDFDRLENEGLIHRAHGGAIAEHRMEIELDYRTRQLYRAQEKDKIAQIAASLIKDGQSIFLDAGTTVLAMVKFIKPKKNIHIVTSSLPVQIEMVNEASIDLIVVGGQMQKFTMSYVGPLAIENIQSMRFDWAFLGTGGIDVDRGLTHSTIEEIPIKKAASLSSSKIAVLADNTKFYQPALSLIMPIDDVDYIITDKPVEDFQRILLERKSKAKVLWPGQTPEQASLNS